MKTFRLIFFLAAAATFVSCTALQQATNTTGGTLFSLNGKWQLQSNSPENTLTGTVITVSPLVSEGRITTLNNNTQCFREADVKWKNIKATGTGGFRIDNLLSACNSSSLVYQIANIEVVNNSEIRVTGQNSANQDNVQVWKKIQ